MNSKLLANVSAITAEMEMMMTSTRPDVPALYTLLTYRRSHGSEGEKRYIQNFIMPLNPRIIVSGTETPMAFFVYVGKSDIMFTSHTDTVHMTSEKVFQDVVLENGLYCKKDNQPLGADDAAGNWLMFNMIHRKIPGIYAFFRGEERGGIGSSYCAEKRKDLFENIKCAIALDRRGTTSVITHQGAGRGCSDEFGKSLAQILNMGHVLDDTGVYTDTAEFFGIVPNCTNLSVGYDREHSKNETLNKAYIEALRDSLIAADWSKLDHTPPKADPIERGYGFNSRGFSLFTADTIQEPRYVVPDLDVGPLQIGDFLYDYADRLPPDLRDKALKLAQRIYKRFEM
jgi:hypothetical protein